MSGFSLLGVIISDNGTQFISSIVVDFTYDLGVLKKFIYVVHPQANMQVESTNKLILGGIKKNLTKPKSYGLSSFMKCYGHITPPHI